MDKVMSWEEIEEAFDGEWVLIEDPECTPSHQVIRGRVVFHSKKRSEVSLKMRELPRLHHAVFYVGEPPHLDFLINIGLPGGYGIYDWRDSEATQSK